MSETATEHPAASDEITTGTDPVALGWRTRAVWIATSVMFLMVTKGPVSRIRFEAAPLTGDFIDDLRVWWRSGSLTPVFGLVAALAAVALLLLTLPGPRAGIRRRIALVIGGRTTLVVVLGVAASGAIATRLDRFQFAGDRPVHGWGFMAAWTRPEIIDASGQQYGREVYEAHSGFVEVLLGVGATGRAVSELRCPS